MQLARMSVLGRYQSVSVVSLTWARTKDARIIGRQFADKLRQFATMLYRASQRLPNPVALRFAPGSERGVSWLRLAITANIVERIDYEARWLCWRISRAVSAATLSPPASSSRAMRSRSAGFLSCDSL